MNAHWRVRRTVSAQDTGQQRWDLAYQCLLRWREDSSGLPCTETDGHAGNIDVDIDVVDGDIDVVDGDIDVDVADGDTIKEAPHGCRPVCAGVNPPTATDPDH